MDGRPTLSAEEVERWLDGVSAGGEATTLPHTSTVATMSTNKLAVLGAPVWVTERNKDDWTATVGSDQAAIEDCCADGATILSQMNPESYQMPLGTRVVCIKTQHLDNLHIALQRGVWVTADKVGEKINRVFDEHDREGGEKVLFIFSINKQRAFCALAEMNGPWVKDPVQLPGWKEVAGGFNSVGSIPVTFTHVKNIANDHFDQIHHENPNQPITNMWNGMHFQLDKGREVVQIFHEKPHFTNLLCRDKRKRYTPFAAVTSAQDIDPTITRKYLPPPQRFVTRARGGRMPHAISNWRTETTPTRAHPPKHIEAREDGDSKTPTPTQPRSIKRDHAPTPLKFRTPTAPAPQASPSPRPGQIIKCVVDADCNYVPIGPPEDSPSAPAVILQEPSRRNATSPGIIRKNENPSSWRQQTEMSIGNGSAGGYGARHDSFKGNQRQEQQPGQQQGSSMPRLLASESSFPSSPQLQYLASESSFPPFPQPQYLPSESNFPSPPRPQYPTEAARKGAEERMAAGSDGTTSTDLLRRAAMRANYFVPELMHPQTFDVADTSALLAANINPSALNPRNIARHAYEKNERLLSYQAMRRQQSSADGSAVSTIPSEYQDWASTSEVERMRVAPVSPLTNSQPSNVDSISKSGSPTKKAFRASVNREIRNMRQGERAMAIPSKFRSDSDAQGTVQSPQKPEYPDSPILIAIQVDSMDGGVPVPRGSTASHMQTEFQPHRQVQHSRGLSTMSGAGQLPRSVITDMDSAGQYAPVDEGIDLSSLSQSLEQPGDASREQIASGW